jgi:microcystin-dependent protein
MSDPFIGQITLFPFNFAPEGWADCAGQMLPIQQHTALFSLLGTTYGGDGLRTFALPNLSGRVAVSQGKPAGSASNYILGDRGGAETVALAPAALPPHSHALNATTGQATTTVPSGALFATSMTAAARQPDRGYIYSAATPDTALAPNAVAPAGSSQPHNNVQPSLALRYCIALQGIYPMRP